MKEIDINDIVMNIETERCYLVCSASMIKDTIKVFRLAGVSLLDERWYMITKDRLNVTGTVLEEDYKLIS